MHPFFGSMPEAIACSNWAQRHAGTGKSDDPSHIAILAICGERWMLSRDPVLWNVRALTGEGCATQRPVPGPNGDDAGRVQVLLVPMGPGR